ncbi:hypothetical protein BY458DRAFT_522442 [Sporodiniella umbellata]|nr:hypothetical protein BY458DRAFT_522442 [Sporodiniella umbellata]
MSGFEGLGKKSSHSTKSRNSSSLEMEETNEEERIRQEKNKEEIDLIQERASQDEEKRKENERKRKAENKPGTLLDASGRAHLKNPEDQVYKDEKQILPERGEPNAKFWAGSEGKGPFDTSPEQSDRRHQLSRIPSFAGSTFSDVKSVFSVKNTSGPQPISPRRKLRHSTPLHPTQPDVLVEQIQIKTMKYVIVTCSLCYIIGRLNFGIILILMVIGFSAWTYWNLGQTSSNGLEWQLEKQESVKTLYTTEGESVEWLNLMLEKIWRSIDPELFIVIEDLLEDTIESVAPGVIKAVKVSDFDIGSQAPRIQMIRVFPPVHGHSDESIFGEASFSFHANPVASVVNNQSPKSAPPGLSIRFQTALHAPLDVKAELTALSGKIRFKLLTAQEIPFISKATIAFTSVPKIETGVMPLSKHLNIMNLPTIKTLVNEGVKLGFADFVDPKSLTVDVRALMGAFAQDTNAIGVIKVEVYEALRDSSIQLQDMEDSYATLSLSTQPKNTLSSTRILTNDKDPRWNENLYVLVYADDIVSEATVDVKVWDADKIKFDDMWGSVSMTVKDAVRGEIDELGNVSKWSQEECVVHEGWTSIDGKSLENSKIRLNMKMSFHPKYATPSADFLSCMKPQDNNSQKEKHEEPLDPDHTNGILSVTIDQAADLEIGDPSILPPDDRFKHPYNPHSIVNPYAVLYINDNKIYRTRTKLRNPNPHWNAINEHFIRDADNCSIRISVKTSLELERDPVLGTKVITLKDLFNGQDGKFREFQKWVPLSDGIGFGKILLNIKYKPVKMTIPHSLQGSDVGTLVVERLVLNDLKDPFNSANSSSTKATLALNVEPRILKRLKSRNLSNENNVNGWYDQHLYFPLIMRYRTAVYVHISQGALIDTKATGRLWLKDLIDNEWQEVTVGLRSPIGEKSKEANKNEDPWPEQGELGQVSLRLKIIPGFSPVHTNLRSYRKDMVGADPFYADTLKYQAQQWVKEKGDDSDNEPTNPDLQKAIGEELQSTTDSDTSTLSSEYGENGDQDSSEEEAGLDDDNVRADMINQRKKNKINKHRVVRKLTWGIDKMKNKVDLLREGFNSERRAKRSVAKEV